MFSENEWRRKRYREDPEIRRKKSERNRAYLAAHRDEINARRRLRRRLDPELREKEKARRYGLSWKEYKLLLRRHGGICRICKRKFRRLSIDHDHLTRKVRGLLCDGCNKGLGNFRDDPNSLRAGAAYLEASRDDQPARSYAATNPGARRRRSIRKPCTPSAGKGRPPSRRASSRR